MRIDGIDFEFATHHIHNPPNNVPPGWVYLIRPPDESIGGVDSTNPPELEHINKLKSEGFIQVSSTIYDEFLRTRRINMASRLEPGLYEEYIQMRYDLIHARFHLGHLTRDQMTWGEWEDFAPSCLGYTGPIDREQYLILALELSQ